MFALTIAGGKGERMRPLTDNLPKPMVDLLGKPLLQHQARMLTDNGVTDIVFLCGYKGERIRQHFGDGSSFGFRAHYSFEQKPLGRGGALKQGLKMVPQSERRVFALNGDILTSQPLAQLEEQHRSADAAATIMLTPYPNTYGVVESQGGLVTRFAEKVDLPHWINAGVYLLERHEVEPLLPEVGDHEDGMFPKLAADGKLACVRSRQPWRAVDTLKDRAVAEQMLQDGLLQAAGD